MDLDSRPDPGRPGGLDAGRTMPHAFPCADHPDRLPGSRAVRDFELGWPRSMPGRIRLSSRDERFSKWILRTSCWKALKPAQEVDGIVVRLLNPTDQEETVTVRTAFGASSTTPLRLDGRDSGHPPILGERNIACSCAPTRVADVSLRIVGRRPFLIAPTQPWCLHRRRPCLLQLLLVSTENTSTCAGHTPKLLRSQGFYDEAIVQRIGNRAGHEDVGIMGSRQPLHA